MRNNPVLWLTVACTALSISISQAAAQEKSDKPEKKQATAPAPVHEVAEKRFKSSVELNAAFESTLLKEIVVAPPRLEDPDSAEGRSKWKESAKGGGHSLV